MYVVKMPASYENKIIEGVSCIVWYTKTASSKIPRKEKNAIKKEKTELGERNQNIPILDMCGSDYCDMIIHSENLIKWKQIILSEIDGGVEASIYTSCS